MTIFTKFASAISPKRLIKNFYSQGGLNEFVEFYLNTFFFFINIFRVYQQKCLSIQHIKGY